MAISGTDWASATDPFILAFDHAYTGTLNELTFNRIRLYNSEGFINGVVDDKDVQEIYWSKDTDVSRSWAVNAFQTLGNGPAASSEEFGNLDQKVGAVFDTFYPQDLIEDDTKDAFVYTTGKSGGAVLYSLFAFTAYAWALKDPAQIIFSWIAHHVDSIWTLKDFLDQATFQDASDYYDENPCHLSMWREVGMSIDAQMKKVMDHTSDFLVIGPQDTTGDVLLSLKTKRSGLTTRTASIDLTGESVRNYTIRPTDRYTVDKITSSFGSFLVMANGNTADDPADYLLAQPVEFPSENRNHSIQKVGTVDADRSVSIDCPYHVLRRNLLSHIDIGFWKDDQDEIEIEFADLSHFNFEAGDIVPVTGKGYDGTELFLVTEKIVDWDTMLATCRMLMLRGIDGKSAVYADEPNLILNLRPNALGLFFDGSVSFPADVPLSEVPRNFDRLWGESGYAHATEHTRGTVGPGPGPPTIWPLAANKRERWPAFELATDTGLELPNDSVAEITPPITSGTSAFTFYWVGNPTSTIGPRCLFESYGTFPDVVGFAAVGGAGTHKVQFFDGTWQGTVTPITGWQILVFVLHPFAGNSKIRRNGADIETGLTYTARTMAVTHDYGLGVYADGNGGVFQGDWGECALFKTNHDAATVAAIEAHLAEKYGITI